MQQLTQNPESPNFLAESTLVRRIFEKQDQLLKCFQEHLSTTKKGLRVGPTHL